MVHRRPDNTVFSPGPQAADGGQYQCVAESEAGSVERTVTLRVQSKYRVQILHWCVHEVLEMKYCPPPPTQSTEDTRTGRSGVPAAAAVDQGSRNGSAYATVQNRPMGAEPAAVPVPSPGSVRLVCVQVPMFLLLVLNLRGRRRVDTVVHK